MRKLTLILALIAGLFATSIISPNPASAVTGSPYRFWEEASSGLAVNGSYFPVVGNFGGGGQDDIVWWGPGSIGDSIWLSNNDATFAKSAVSPQIGLSSAEALVGDFGGNGYEDILFYGSGSAPDALWVARGDGSFDIVSVGITGAYEPVVLDDATGKDDVVWIRRTDGTGSVWSFTGTAGAHTSTPLTFPAGSIAIVGRFTSDRCADVFWYRPGTASDRLDAMDCAGTASMTTRQTVNGSYEPVVAQFSPVGGTVDDILWHSNTGRSSLWEADGRGGFTSSSFLVPAGLPIAAADATGFVHIETAAGSKVWWPVAPGIDFQASITNTPVALDAEPLVGSFVGDHEDIFWYRRGSAPERMFFLTR